MALTSDEDRVIRRANMHLVGRQLDPARVRRDLWRLAEWERRRRRPAAGTAEPAVSGDLRSRSRVILDGPDRAQARAYLKGIGFDDDALQRPIIGIANTWTETMPCNFHLRRLAEKVKEGVRAAGGTPMEFNTVAISDGITMGTEGMKASLVSREVIADSIELVARGHMFDAVVALSGCDKTIPGCVMALARLDVPSLMLYGGSIAPGRWRGKDVTIQDVFEGIGAHAAGDLTDDELTDLENHASPGAGACGGQFTANTMAMAFEVLGISPMGSSMVPAEDGKKGKVAEECGRLVLEVLAARPAAEHASSPSARSRTRSRRAPCRAARPTSCCTCSRWPTRPVWSSSSRTSTGSPGRPRCSCDLKPGGRYVATDLYRAGGVPLVIKRLKEAGLLHEDELTVTGQTIGAGGGRRRGDRGPGRGPPGRPTRSSRTAASRSCAATWRRRAAW